MSLKPCPFCGGTEIIQFWLLHESDFRSIRCDSCQCGTGGHYDIEEAKAAWNKRVPVPVPVVSLGNAPVLGFVPTHEGWKATTNIFTMPSDPPGNLKGFFIKATPEADAQMFDPDSMPVEKLTPRCHVCGSSNLIPSDRGLLCNVCGQTTSVEESILPR